MRKTAIAAALILTALTATSCATSSQPVTTAPTAVAATSESTEEVTSSVTDTAVSIATETVGKKSAKATEATTKPTEPTEKPTKKSKQKKETKPVPTQGRTKPNTRVVVRFPLGSFSDDDLVFRKGDYKIELGEDMEDVLKRLKKKGDITELSEKKKVYDYSNFSVTTKLFSDGEYVEQIEITDDTLETPKGVKIGTFASRLRKIYGDPVKKTADAYYYGRDDETLVFTISDDMVDGIYYIINF